MKTVLITGSAKGFGYAMAKEFRENNYNCVLCDVDIDNLTKSYHELKEMKYDGVVDYYQMNVCNYEEILKVIDAVYKKFDRIDIWINNAGVNQPDDYFYNLDNKVIDKLVDIDLKGVMYSSKAILSRMIDDGGAIYNVEGHGSNDAIIPKLTLYGTSKRAVTYFSDSLAKEVDGKVIIGKIAPGIMITNFIHTSANGEKIEIPEKTKKIYNILGDYPETIAKYIVKRILKNKKNGKRIMWLTNRRAFIRFIKYTFKKRDLFNEK